MNILQINTLDEKGGAAKVASQLKTELAKLGHTTTMFVKLKYSNDPALHIARWPSPITKLVKNLTGKDIGSFLENKLRSFLANDVDFFSSDRILSTKEFKDADIIHCHNLHGNYFKLSTLQKMTRLKPVVWTLHDMWAITPHCAHTGIPSPINGFFACENLTDYQELMWDNSRRLTETKRNVYGNSDFTVVTPCRWLERKVSQSILNTKPREVIYNGVHTDIFKPQDKAGARAVLGLPADKKILLFIASGGLQNQAKGGAVVMKLIEEYKNDPDIVFLVIGATGDQSSDNSQVLSRQYEYKEKTMAHYYAACDVLLLPSPHETFPLVILEANACGLPAVGFNIGGIPEVITHKESGYLAKGSDTEDFIAGVKFLMTCSEQERQRLSANAIGAIKEKFTLRSTVAGYIALYERLIKN